MTKKVFEREEVKKICDFEKEENLELGKKD